MTKTFTTQTGVTLELVPVPNQNAIQSLMADAGIFDRASGKLRHGKSNTDLAAVVRDWNRLFAYVVMNGVATEPSPADVEMLEETGFVSKSPAVTKLNWIRYGKAGDVDVLTTQQEAAQLVMDILTLTFGDATADEPDEDEDD